MNSSVSLSLTSIRYKINVPNMFKVRKKAGDGMSENQMDGTERNKAFIVFNKSTDYPDS